MFAGIFLYTGLNYLLYIRGYQKDYIFVLFGWLCLLSAAYAVVTVSSYHAVDVASQLEAAKYRYVLARLIMMILMWFIGAYTDYIPKMLLSVLSLLALFLAICKLLLPVATLYPNIRGMGYLTTPWGEHLTTVICDISPLTYLLYAVYVGLFYFAFRAGMHLYRSGGKGRTTPLFLSYGFGLVAFGNDILVDANLIQNMYIEDFAIFNFVLLVGGWLNTRRMHAEGNYRNLFHTVSDAIFVHDAKTGKILDVNETTARMFGATRQELMTGDISRLSAEVAPYRSEDAVGLIRSAAEGKPQVFEWLSRRVDNGQLFHTEVALRHAVIDGRSVVMAVVRNIEDRIKALDEKSALEKQMFQAQKLESLGLLSGSVAHDFNNLLTTILGNAVLIQKSLPDGASSQAQLEHLINATQRASALCRQLLAYSGKGSFVVEALSLRDAVEDITRILEVSIPKNIQLNLRFDPHLPYVLADATQIRQVVMNLITNSVEAIGDRPGLITLSAKAESFSRDELKDFHGDSNLSSGSFACLEITDNGSGMDSETISRVFEPFFSTKFTGRGLGMAAVFGIIKGHQGAIKINSEPGRGTQVMVLFPTTDDKPAKSDAVKSQPPVQPGPQATVLLVDDDKSVLMTVESITEMIGFKSLSAESGKGALELFQKHHREISCVILDLTMPDMDGSETLRELKKIDPSVPVILTSGYSEQSSKDRVNQQEIAGFLQKPYKLEDFERMIHSVINPGAK